MKALTRMKWIMISSWCEVVSYSRSRTRHLYDLDTVFCSGVCRLNANSITAIELFRGKNNLQITRSAFFQPCQRSQIVLEWRLGLNIRQVFMGLLINQSRNQEAASLPSLIIDFSVLPISHAAKQPPPPIPVPLIIFPTQPISSTLSSSL
jgi:hypothetical protein